MRETGGGHPQKHLYIKGDSSPNFKTHLLRHKPSKLQVVTSNTTPAALCICPPPSGAPSLLGQGLTFIGA